MQFDKFHSQCRVPVQQSAETGFQADNSVTCCVCMKLFISADHSKPSTFGSHPGMGMLCGKVCEQICMQVHTFVQGFVFCRVLCLLLDKNSVYSHNSVRKENVTLGVQEVISKDNFTVLSQPASPHSPESVSSLSTMPVTFDSCTDVTSQHPTNGKNIVSLPSDRRVDRHALLNIKKSRGKVYDRRKLKAKHSLNFENDETTYSRIRCSKSIVKRKRKLKKGERNKTEAKEGGRTLNEPISFPTGLKKLKKMHHADVSSECEDVSKEPEDRLLSMSITEGLKTPSIVKNPKKTIMNCRLCGKKCIGQAGLSVHTQIRHAGEKAVECEICGERFTCSRECEKHRKKVHHKTEGVCHICGKHFKYRHALLAHIKAHTGVKGFVCEQCGKAFLRMTTLCSHRKRMHCCKECRAELVSGQCPVHPSHSQSREKRQPVLDSLNMLQCRECNEILGNLQSLETHMKAHKMQRPYHCRVCGNGFHTPSSLTKHNKQHQEKKFKCNLCDKTFTYKCNMQKHLETHVEGRPFQCEFCSKTFKTKGVMDKHIAMHIEDKQYKCHLCGKGLTRLQTLKNHMMKMHPDSGISGSVVDG